MLRPIFLFVLLFGNAVVESPAQTSIEKPSPPKPDLVLQSNPERRWPLFSPDGKRLATGGLHSPVRLWDVGTGIEVRPPVGRVAPEGVPWLFSRDGRLAAMSEHAEGQVVHLLESRSGREVAGCALKSWWPVFDRSWKLMAAVDGKEVEIRSTDSCQRLQALVAHSARVLATDFGPDGSLLATASADKTIRIWDSSTGRELRTLRGRGDAVRTVLFSPSGKFLASGGDDKTIRFWDAESGQPLRTVNAGGVVRAVGFGPEGRWLSSIVGEKTIKIWDTDSGRELRSLDGLTANIIAWRRSGPFLAIATADHLVTLFDLETGHRMRTFADQEYGTVSPDGQMLAARGLDGSIKLWDVLSGRELRTLEGTTGSMLIEALSSNWKWAATLNSDKTVGVWDVSTLRESLKLPPQRDFARAEFSPEGRYLAIASKDQTVKIWEVATGRDLHTLRGFRGPISALAFGPKSRVLATGAEDGQVKLWELETGSDLRTLSGHSKRVFKIAFRADGVSLATASWDGTVRLWDAASGHSIRTLSRGRQPFSGLAFSPDLRFLALGMVDGTVRLLESGTGREINVLVGHEGGVRGLDFTPDGKRLITSSDDKTIKLWDLGAGREERTLSGHRSGVFKLFISPEGRWIYSAGQDGTRIWDIRSGNHVASFAVAPASDDWVVVTPEGLFDGTEQGMQKLVAWKVGDRIFPPERFFADYYTPDLLKRIRAGEQPRPQVDLANLKLPPDVRITSPVNSSLRQRRVEVAVETTDLGGGVAEVRLYQNGRRVETITGHGPTFRFEVELAPGENILKATAFSKERIESNQDVVRLVYEGSVAPKPVLRLLVVGINRYEDSSLNLGFARQDAEALANFFERRGNGLFGSVQTIKLFDNEASLVNVRKALAQLAEQAQPEDVVLIYMSGHGVGMGQQYFFLTREMRKEENEESAIRKYGLSDVTLGEALSRVKAQKVVLVLDSCQSQMALRTILARARSRGLGAAEEKAARMMAYAEGIYLIAAATKQQYAAEVPELGHGVLTYALLSGLGEKGEPKALGPGAEMVTVSSLFSYVSQLVPELSEKYQGGEKQYPVIATNGIDFPLLVWPR